MSTESSARSGMASKMKTWVEAVVKAMRFTALRLGADDYLYRGDNDEIADKYDSTKRTMIGPNKALSMWADAPGPWSLRRDAFVYFTHFTSDDYNADNWTKTELQGTNTVALADKKDGWLTITTGATENDGPQYKPTKGFFKLESGKDCLFEAMIEVDEATQMDWFVGLGDTDATNIFTDDDRIGFESHDGDTNIDYVCRKDGTGDPTDSGEDVAADTAVTLGFYYDSANSKVYFRVDDTEVADTTANIPDDEVLSIFFGALTGEADNHVLSVDWVLGIADPTNEAPVPG